MTNKIDPRDPTKTAEDQSPDKEVLKQAPKADKDELEDAKLDDVSGGIGGGGFSDEAWLNDSSMP